jgi:hypothetical protein
MKCLVVVVAALGGFLETVVSSSAQDWTLTSAPITNWSCVASSADGTKLVAAVNGAGIYTSTNSGITWSLTSAPSTNWTVVAQSADGNKLVAATSVPIGSDAIYTSTNSGLSWIQTSASLGWGLSIASCADGSKLVAAAQQFPGPIYISTNSGTDWTLVAQFIPVCYSVASSADGTVLVASEYGGTPYGGAGAIVVSTNSFSGWTTTFAGGLWSPCALALSVDGAKLVAAVEREGPIFTSTNSGTTLEVTSAPRYYWSSVASSADGSRLVAGVAGGPIFTSMNSGVSWISNQAPSRTWSSVASSADGCKLVAAVNGGGIYTWQTTPTPVLSIAPSGSKFVLSWIIPSAPFVLQQAADLATPNWTDVPTPPILNLTNLQHQVTVPLSSSNRFFWLKGI